MSFFHSDVLHIFEMLDVIVIFLFNILIIPPLELDQKLKFYYF